jgi:hypothetical protein
MSHDFGFGILRTRALRLWLGPELRFTKINDKANGYDVDIRGFGFGLALGLNINITGPVTIGLKASFLNQTLDGHWTYDDPVFGLTKEDISSEDEMELVTVALIYRFGERF